MIKKIFELGLKQKFVLYQEKNIVFLKLRVFLYWREVYYEKYVYKL